jgi:hypothetical protein
MLRPLQLLVFVAAPAVVSAQSDPAAWRFVPFNAKAVISVDWKTLRASHLGAMLREKFIDANPGPAMPGIEFLDNVDRCIIASTGRGPGELTTDPALLVVIRGNFDVAKVRKVLEDHGAKPQQFNSIQVYRPQNPSSRDMAFVLVDPQTIVLGDANSVFAAVERSRLPVQPGEPNGIQARAAEMDSHYDVWAIMSGVQSGSSDRIMGLLAGAALSSDARSFQAGIALRNGLVADISFIFPSEPEARNMATEFSKLMKAAVKDKVGGPAMIDLEKKMKVAADGATTRISLRLSPEELEKNARLFAQSRPQPQAAPIAEEQPAAATLPAAATAKATPPTPKVIKIDGLDDGPREIKIKPDQP